MKKFQGLIITVMLFVAFQAYAEPVHDLGVIVVEALRGGSTYSQANKPVTIIPQETIATSGAQTVQELVSQSSSIHVTNYLSSPKGVVVDVRGFGETSALNLLVLVDGRRTNQVDLSGVDWGQISIETIERIEIIRGTSAVLYGDNAEAGIINIVTKSGSDMPIGEMPEVEFGGEYGSYQTHKEFATLQGRVEQLNYALNYTHQESTGYRVNDEYWSNNYHGRLTYQPKDNVVVDVSAGYHRDRYGNPGALFASNLATIGRKGSRFPGSYDFVSDGYVNIEPKVDFMIGDSEASFSLFGTLRRRNSQSFSVSEASVYETIHKIFSKEVQPKMIVKTDLSESIQNELLLGFDYFGAIDKIRSGSQGGSQDFLNIRKQTYDFYAFEKIIFDDAFFIDFGGRASWAEYDFNQTAVIEDKTDKSLNAAAYSVSLGYKYNSRSQIYFDIAKSYRLPTTEEFYTANYDFGFGFSGGGLNTSIKKQSSRNYEFGFRDQSIKNISINGNFFVKDVQNEIYLDPATYTNTNYDAKTRHYGFELEASGNYFDGKFQPFVNGLIQESFFKGGSYSGKTVPFVPQNIVSAGITVAPLEKWRNTLSMDFVGKRFAISDPTNSQPKLDSYTIFNYRTSYTYKDIGLWFKVNNLFNREYNTYAVYNGSDIGFYPAAQLNMHAGVKFKF